MMALGVGASGRQGVAVQDTARPRAGQGAVGELFNPDVAGRPRTPTIAGDNDAAIRAVEQKLGCTCGCTLDIFTCRTTDFTCTYSPALHKEVVTLAQQGKNAQQIIDAFVAQYGEAALMAPPRRGFNLAGYFVPSLAIIIAAFFLVRVLRRWTREAEVVVTPTPSPEPPVPNATPAELQRLRDELDRLSG